MSCDGAAGNAPRHGSKHERTSGHTPDSHACTSGSARPLSWTSHKLRTQHHTVCRSGTASLRAVPSTAQPTRLTRRTDKQHDLDLAVLCKRRSGAVETPRGTSCATAPTTVSSPLTTTSLHTANAHAGAPTPVQTTYGAGATTADSGRAWRCSDRSGCAVHRQHGCGNCESWHRGDFKLIERVQDYLLSIQEELLGSLERQSCRRKCHTMNDDGDGDDDDDDDDDDDNNGNTNNYTTRTWLYTHQDSWQTSSRPQRSPSCDRRSLVALPRRRRTCTAACRRQRRRCTRRPCAATCRRAACGRSRRCSRRTPAWAHRQRG
jgi:hypothetical protein